MVNGFSVEFTPQAADDLSGMTKPIAQRLLDKIRWLATNFDAVTPTALSGDLVGVYKLRVGDYRVLYALKTESSSICIVRIRHRKDVYKNL